MAKAVASFCVRSSLPGVGAIDPPIDRRDELWRLYQMHVDDYRFQVQLNNQRFQWYTALDVAVITIGTGLLRVSDHGDGRFLTALIFVTGVALAAFAGVATRRQVGYQHAARERAKSIADKLGVSELAIASTPAWRGGRNRWWDKARTVNYALLVVLGAGNAAGVAYIGVVR